MSFLLSDEVRAERREARLNEVQALLTFLKENPELPVPWYWANTCDAQADDKEQLLQLRKKLGRKVEKVVESYQFGFKKSFGDHVEYSITVPREEVCERVVTGTRVEPAYTVEERVVEEYDYICPDSFLKELKGE